MIDHYAADVKTVQDYYPFGMIMPGRMLATLSIPGGSFSGTTQVNGYTLPMDLTLTGRTGNQPTSYVATDFIDLDDGFESGTNDDVTTYIADGSYAGGGNGGNDNAVAGGGGYRYGFNGKEQDPEIKGTGNQYDYGFRIYDPRIGKFLSIDPLQKKYPYLSTYQYASDNPVLNVDIDGLEGGRFWERFWKDPADAVYRFSWDDANEVAGTVNNATPPGAIINGGIQAITDKDPTTWEKAPRIDGFGQAVIGGLFHLTVTRFVSPGLKTANLERQMAENAAARTNKSAIAATGSKDAVESNTATKAKSELQQRADEIHQQQSSFAQRKTTVVMPDGSVRVPSQMRLVPGGKGVKTVYPEL